MNSEMSELEPKPLIAIRGGGTLPSESFGIVNATWPFSYLQADEQVVQVDLTWPWKKPPFNPAATVGQRRPTWIRQWSELKQVVTAGQTVVFLSKSGRGCRFIAVVYWELAFVLSLAESHGIEQLEVASTLPYTMRI